MKDARQLGREARDRLSDSDLNPLQTLDQEWP